jgi:hypothetical protein
MPADTDGRGSAVSEAEVLRANGRMGGEQSERSLYERRAALGAGEATLPQKADPDPQKIGEGEGLAKLIAPPTAIMP